MRSLLAGFCALAISSAVSAQEGLIGPGCSGPRPDIIIPGSGYSTYIQVFPPGCCYSRYALVFPPGCCYSSYGRLIPTPGHGCGGPLPMVPLVTEAPAPPAAPDGPPLR